MATSEPITITGADGQSATIHPPANPTTPATTPATPPQTPQNPAPQPTHTPGAPDALGGVLAQIGQSLAALPEQVANAVREAWPPPASQASDTGGSAGAGAQSGAPGAGASQPAPGTPDAAIKHTPEGRKRTFGERWFGVNAQ